MAEKKSFPLRISPQLYEVLERWAADQFRSVNGQIEFILRDAARRAGRLPGSSPSAPDEGNPDKEDL
jgi:hypothetical protein